MGAQMKSPRSLLPHAYAFAVFPDAGAEACR